MSSPPSDRRLQQPVVPWERQAAESIFPLLKCLAGLRESQRRVRCYSAQPQAGHWEVGGIGYLTLEILKLSPDQHALLQQTTSTSSFPSVNPPLPSSSQISSPPLGPSRYLVVRKSSSSTVPESSREDSLPQPAEPAEGTTSKWDPDVIAVRDPSLVKCFRQQFGGRLISLEDANGQHLCFSFQHSRCCDILWAYLRRVFPERCMDPPNGHDTAARATSQTAAVAAQNDTGETSLSQETEEDDEDDESASESGDGSPGCVDSQLGRVSEQKEAAQLASRAVHELLEEGHNDDDEEVMHAVASVDPLLSDDPALAATAAADDVDSNALFHTEFLALEPVLDQECNSDGDAMMRLPQCPSDVKEFRALERRLRGLETLRHLRSLLQCTLRHITSSDWLGRCNTVVEQAVSNGDTEVAAAAGAMFLRIIAMSAALTDAAQFWADVVSASPTEPIVRLFSDQALELVFITLAFDEMAHATSLFFGAQERTAYQSASSPREHVNWLLNVAERRRLNLPHEKNVAYSSEPLFSQTATLIYRLLYFRDVCLARRLAEEATAQRLTALINTGYCYLAKQVQGSGAAAALHFLIPTDYHVSVFLLQLQMALRSNLAANEERFALYMLIRRGDVLESLRGYFSGDCDAARDWMSTVVEHCERNAVVRAATGGSETAAPLLLLSEVASEIIHLTAETMGPQSVRQAMLNIKSSDGISGAPAAARLCNAALTVFRCCDNEGVQILVADLFKRLLEPPPMREVPADYEDFLTVFYDLGILDELINIALCEPPGTWSALLEDACSDHPRHAHTNILNLNSLTPEDLEFWRTHVKRRGTLLQLAEATVKKGTAVPAASTGGGIKRISSETGGGIIDATNAAMDGNPDTAASAAAAPPVKRRRADIVDQTASHEMFAAYAGDGRAESRCGGAHLGGAFGADDGYNSAPAIAATLATARAPPLAGAPLPIYKNFIDWWYYSKASTEEDREIILTEVRDRQNAARGIVIELMAHCVLSKSPRMKIRNLEAQLHLRLIRAACVPRLNIPLALQTLKYLKACLRPNQGPHYHRLFAQDDVLKYVLYLLTEAVPRPHGKDEGSLLEASLLDFLNIVVTQTTDGGSSPLLRQLITDYAPHLADVASSYADLTGFSGLRELLFRQQQQALRGGSCGSSTGGEWDRQRSEERYFDDDEDNESVSATRPQLNQHEEELERRRCINDLLHRDAPPPSTHNAPQNWFADDEDEDTRPPNNNNNNNNNSAPPPTLTPTSAKSAASAVASPTARKYRND